MSFVTILGVTIGLLMLLNTLFWAVLPGMLVLLGLIFACIGLVRGLVRGLARAWGE